MVKKTNEFKQKLYEKALDSAANISESIEDFIADLQSEKKSVQVNVSHKSETAQN